jgi:hypothetical protein
MKALRYLLFGYLLILALEVTAQRPIRRPDYNPSRDRRDQRTTSTSDFKDKLWYGGNLNLGFQSGFNSNLFFFALAPMVGYKVTPEFSIGPRAEFSYSFFKVAVPGNILRYNLFGTGIGPFARYKFFNTLFFHTEYLLEYAQFPGVVLDGSKSGQFFSNYFVGLGYNSGGFEILILYNLLDQTRNTLDLPISMRFGFTYNF